MIHLLLLFPLKLPPLSLFFFFADLVKCSRNRFALLLHCIRIRLLEGIETSSQRSLHSLRHREPIHILNYLSALLSHSLAVHSFKKMSYIVLVEIVLVVFFHYYYYFLSLLRLLKQRALFTLVATASSIIHCESKQTSKREFLKERKRIRGGGIPWHHCTRIYTSKWLPHHL